MKKFLALSAVIAVAGLGIGIASRGGSDGQPAEAAITTSTTVNAEAPQSTPTTGPKAATKTATKPTTATTGAKVATPSAVVATTSTTRPAATTTTSAPAPTTSTTGPTATCTVTVASPSTHKGDPQEVRVSSNMPATKTRITIQYPKFNTGRPNPRQTFTPTTDGTGSAAQSFNVIDTSTEPVWVEVELYNAAGHPVPVCHTTFMSN